MMLSLPDGHSIQFPIEDFEKVKADPIGYAAKHYGVDEWRFRAWIHYMDSACQCTGTTKKGNQCRNAGEDLPSLANFLPGVSDRCDCHVDISSHND